MSVRTFGGPTRWQKFLILFALVALCIPALMPMAWMVSTSLKTDKQIFALNGTAQQGLSLSQFIPNPVRIQNYADALTTVPFRVYVRNTVFLCIVNIFGAVLSSALVAFGFAKLEFKGKKLLFLVMISTMAIPGQVTMVPVFAMFRAFGWYGTYLPLTVPSFFASPFYVFLLSQFFKTLPNEMVEAARTDGASDLRIFLRLIFPLSRPALATCALFQFMGTWNDFFGPLLYINDSRLYTVAYGLQQFLSQRGGQWTLLMAGATLFTLPVILLFFFAQKTFIQGIATTGGRN
jgi:multiple sugar transport system permease protein